jgi:hypothetical protein
MSKNYNEGIDQLTKLKDDPDLGQSNKLKERAAAIVRTFGDSEMKATFDRLTKFRATTDESTRLEKTMDAIDLMTNEFKLKLSKSDSTDKDGLPSKKASSSFWTSGTGISIIVTLILAAVGGAYTLGFDNGSVKFDKEKIDLQKTIDSLRQQIKEIEQSESDEIKRLKIENKNVWDTYYKVLDENERLKKKK